MLETDILIQQKYLTGVSSVVGDTRRKYEDRADLKQVQTAGGLNLLVAIVADGVGSADNGGLAAQLSINSVVSYMTESEETDIPLLITNALKYANYIVYKDVLTRNVDASTTLIVGVFHKDRFYVGNVGDSRAYWIQESGKMVQLTMDHSYYNIKGGDPNSPQAEALVNAIGIRKEIYADVGMYIKGPDRKLATKLGVQGLPLKVGDTILLCSDGLIKDNLQGERFVKDEEITQALQSEVQPNAAAVKMTGLAEGRYVDDNVTVVTVQHTTPERIENVLAKQYRKSLRQKLIYVALGLLVLVGIITGAFLIKENQRTKQYYASLPTQTPAIVTLPTEVPTPTEVPRLAGEIEAIRVGFFDAENGLYQDRYAGEADYPTWKLGESDSPNPIQLNRYYQLNDGKMSVQTFGDVGVRFSIGSQDSSGQSSGNNQLYVYGGSSLTVGSNEQKRTIISLAEGSVFLKMSGGNEIAEIDFPNHNNTKARLTGGSGLLVTDTESISFWCLNEDCQFEFGDDAKTLRKGQIRVYNSNQMTMSDEIKGFSPPSERYDEYLLWNNRCNHCLPFDYVPEPTPMPTLAFFTPSPDTGGKPGEKTPTPSKYTLTVIVEGQGTVSPSGGIYDAGARVSLTASPDSGWKFASWSTGTPSLTTTIIMDSDKIITARFVKEAAVLYTLTVNIEGQGTVEPNGGQFEKGTTVTLTATPAEGWEFSKWSTGATSPTTTVKMDGNKSIKAIFTQKMYTLTVNTEGQGTVSPTGGSYPSGTVVTLKATPASGWKLASWSTGESTTTIKVKMDSNKTIKATFVKEAATLYTLTVNIEGNGAVNPNGGKFEKGTVVTLTAAPAEGWNFSKWSTGGTSRTTKVTMDGDKTITATFTQIMYTLTVNVSGQGTVEPSGGSYAAGTVVTLTATPKDGWIFSKWSTGETDPVITVTMNSNRLIGALFTEIPASQKKLTVNIRGNGTVSLEPPGGTYDAGTQVTLTANPKEGSVFSGWSDSYGNVSPLTVKMDTDIVIQAIFTEKNYTLTISVGKDGGGTVDPSEGVHEYPAGKEVQLQAHPDEENGWEFKEWSTGETDPDITVTMDSNKTITAYFKMQSGIGGRQSGPDVFFSTFNNSVFEHSWNLLKPSQQ